VYRAAGPEEDTECLLSGGTAWYCSLRGEVIGTTRARELVDLGAPEEATYRVGVAANWEDDTEQGDVFAVSPPARSAR
jgi:hypothetical protein